jgi:hypothetical protein
MWQGHKGREEERFTDLVFTFGITEHQIVPSVGVPNVDQHRVQLKRMILLFVSHLFVQELRQVYLEREDDPAR